MTNLGKVRRAKGVSQRDLARRIGEEGTRVWRIENGYADATPDERRSIAKALGVTQREIWPVEAETAPAPSTESAATVA